MTSTGISTDQLERSGYAPVMLKRMGTLAIVGALALAACSEDGDGESAEPSTTTSTLPTPESTEAATTTALATTTTIDPRVTAADEYIRLVGPLNCSGDLLRLIEADFAGPDGTFGASEWNDYRAQVQPAYANQAQIALTFMNGLIAYPSWPDDVQPDIDALIAEMAADAAFFQAVGTAATIEEYNAIVVPPRSAATIVRAKLGLESNIGNTEDYCASIGF